MSLRPIAAELETSARMLVYHFGSKQELTAAILERVADMWMGILSERMGQDGPVSEILSDFWHTTLVEPAHRDIQTLAFQAWSMGLSGNQPAYNAFLERVAAGWVALVERGFVERGMEPTQARIKATFVVATIEGLLLHRFTDASLPTDEAFIQLITFLKQGEST